MAVNDPLNNVLDDVCAVIGYTATRKLQAWFHTRNLYVPKRALKDHPLERLIGRAAFVKLVESFPESHLWIPSPAEDFRYFTQRQMAEQIAHGWTDGELSRHHDLSVAHVRLLRAELGEAGWVEFAKGSPVKREMAGRNRGLDDRVSRNF